MSRLILQTALSGLLAAGTFVTTSASAHIDMLEPLLSRGGDQKTGPCEGKEWGFGPVYKFEPGDTITITAQEGISHDGYFRIAFDNAGSDGFVDPMSIDPLNPNRYGKGQKCAKDDPSDRCGKSDFCSFVSTTGGPTVLWDKLDPHIPNGLLNGKVWTWKVTLPDVECDKCTIQVMQVMEDANAEALGVLVPTHGPFDGEEELYYRCIDVTLKRGAGESTGLAKGAVDNNGIECAAAVGTDAGVTPDDVVVIIPDAETPSKPGSGDDEEPTDDGDEPGKGTSSGSDSHGKTPGGANGPSTSSDGCSVTHGGKHGNAWTLFGMLALLGLAVRAHRAKSKTLAPTPTRHGHP